MKNQLKTIRHAIEMATPHYQADTERFKQALTALSELERAVGSVESVIYQRRRRPLWGPEDKHPWTCWADCSKGEAEDCWKTPLLHDWLHEARVLYLAPPAQQAVVSVEPQRCDDCGDTVPKRKCYCRDGCVHEATPPAQQPQARPDFTDEWTGYLKDGETPFERFLRERKDLTALTKLYQRALEENERLKAQQPQADTPQATTIAEAARDVGKWLNERPNRPIDLRHVAMLVAHAMQPQAEAVPTIYVSRGQLENLKPDPEDEAGTYLPVRKTPKGKFTHPLFAAPQQAEAMPSSDLNPDEGDPVTLWAEIWRLREAVKGPDGYATWQDAATAERIRRVRAESKQAEEAKAVPTHDDTDLIKQMLEDLRSCSGVSHWPALIPTINAARKRLETPQQAEAVPHKQVWQRIETAPTEVEAQYLVYTPGTRYKYDVCSNMNGFRIIGNTFEFDRNEQPTMWMPITPAEDSNDPT